MDIQCTSLAVVGLTSWGKRLYAENWVDRAANQWYTREIDKLRYKYETHSVAGPCRDIDIESYDYQMWYRSTVHSRHHIELLTGSLSADEHKSGATKRSSLLNSLAATCLIDVVTISSCRLDLPLLHVTTATGDLLGHTHSPPVHTP